MTRSSSLSPRKKDQVIVQVKPEEADEEVKEPQVQDRMEVLYK